MAASTRKVVLITGASSGLGQTLAAHLHHKGYTVYGTSRRSQNPDTFSWPMLLLDVRCDDAVKSCVDTLLEKEGRIDVLINNAGYAFLGALEETTIENARDQMETNFFGPLRMMLAFLPTMRAQGAGHIVNMSSVAGVVGMPFGGVYAASKHALEGVSEALAHEVRSIGLRVTLVEPDGMRTGIRFQGPESAHPELAERRKQVVDMLKSVTAASGSGNDPAMLARAVEEAIESETPPLRIVIGEMAQRLVAAKRTMSEAQFAELLVDLH